LTRLQFSGKVQSLVTPPIEVFIITYRTSHIEGVMAEQLVAKVVL
jgi:hypothetical protein